MRGRPDLRAEPPPVRFGGAARGEHRARRIAQAAALEAIAGASQSTRASPNIAA
jgi:hypothetical protein